jgi:acyl dehydratase
MANVEVPLSELRGMGATDLGASEPLVIDQHRINGFSDATDDHQWIHVDPERAAAGPFGVTIAHGYLTLSLVPRLLADLLVITDQVRGTNYGLNRARFPSAVPVGSQVRMTGRLLAVSDRDDGGVQYKVGVEVRVVGANRPSLVAEVLLLAYDS